MLYLILATVLVPGGTITCKGDCSVKVTTEYSTNTTITNDPGGYIDAYERRYALLKNKRIVVDGKCDSACTMVLSNPRACATPRALFGFHSAFTVVNGIKTRSATGNLIMGSYYNARVRAAIQQAGGLGDRMVYIPGQQLLPACR